MKSGIQNDTKVTLNLSLDKSSNSNDKANFLHNLLLANTQVLRLKDFANNSSANKKLSKTQLSMMIKLGGRTIFGKFN